MSCNNPTYTMNLFSPTTSANPHRITIQCYLYTLIALAVHRSFAAKQPEVYLEVLKAIEPFNDKALLPQPPGAREFWPIGTIQTVGTLLSAPRFFSASFSIYSREGEVKDIRLKPRFHCLKLNEYDDKELQCHDFEFNLTELVPPVCTFNPNRRTIILVPGYLSGDYVEWTQRAKDQWLQLEDVNVILVHWSEGNTKLYDTAMSNVKLVARQVTILLYYLAQVNNLDFRGTEFRSNIQLVGHSLGAHIAGCVGQELGGQVGRITGLDPAGPIFDTLSHHQRLDPSDARLVDVVHTNAGRMHYVKAGLGVLKEATMGLISKLYSPKATLATSLLKSHAAADDTAWFGIRLPCGHIDYYANGGSVQPGCNDKLHLCDHSRVVDIYNSALEYELWFRSRLGGLESHILGSGQHRLVAFSSPNYQHFKMGKSLFQKCPSLLGANLYQLNSSDQIDIGRRCVVPMDFVKRGEELRDELKNTYQVVGIEHPQFTMDEEEGRYYFETLSGEPYVGEHYLLRMHMPRNSVVENRWTKGCRLIVRVNSSASTDLFAQLGYESESLELIETEDFHGLASPIVNPVDWRKQLHAFNSNEGTNEFLPEMNIASESDSNKASKPPAADSIHIILHYTKGRLRQIIETLTSFFRFTIGASKDCQLTFNALEMRPLAATMLNVSSWYLTSEHYDNIVTDTDISNQPEERETKVLSDRGSFSVNSNTATVSLHLESMLYQR